jgi:hypothetical protein
MININTPKQTKPSNKYTEEELMVRLKFFIGICLALTLIGIVFVVLYSIIFVTQPLNAISPVDSKFFELIIPIATFLTGTLSGIMLAGTGKDAAMSGAAQATAAALKPTLPPPPAPMAPPPPPPPVMPPPMSTAAPFVPPPPVIPSPMAGRAEPSFNDSNESPKF